MLLSGGAIDNLYQGVQNEPASFQELNLRLSRTKNERQRAE